MTIEIIKIYAAGLLGFIVGTISALTYSYLVSTKIFKLFVEYLEDKEDEKSI